LFLRVLLQACVLRGGFDFLVRQLLAVGGLDLRAALV
jgi:hypothetical protein